LQALAKCFRKSYPNLPFKTGKNLKKICDNFWKGNSYENKSYQGPKEKILYQRQTKNLDQQFV
jgi:hypothetical protein